MFVKTQHTNKMCSVTVVWSIVYIVSGFLDISEISWHYQFSAEKCHMEKMKQEYLMKQAI